MGTSERLTLPIEGLSCGGGGALSVERAIQRLAGVIRVYVNPVTEAAYVEYDPIRCHPDEIETAVEHTGFRIMRPGRR